MLGFQGSAPLKEEQQHSRESEDKYTYDSCCNKWAGEGGGGAEGANRFGFVFQTWQQD